MKRVIITMSVLFTLAQGAFAVDWKDHPHLQKAHEHLEMAKKEMQMAEDKKKSEFGGHRAEAMKHVNQSQEELVKSVEFANNPANK